MFQSAYSNGLKVSDKPKPYKFSSLKHLQVNVCVCVRACVCVCLCVCMCTCVCVYITLQKEVSTKFMSLCEQFMNINMCRNKQIYMSDFVSNFIN